MKCLVMLLFFFPFNNSLFAQVKPVNKKYSKNVKITSKPAVRPTSKIGTSKNVSPADTASFPEANINPSKMQLPKTVGPSATKLNNSVFKTPVYNNTVTGTNAPGDVNTGLRPGSSGNDHEVNESLKKVRANADSARGPR
ncbi:MAG: hypothetical protein ABIT58_11100 [Ferruginibacter sp.]